MSGPFTIRAALAMALASQTATTTPSTAPATAPTTTASTLRATTPTTRPATTAATTAPATTTSVLDQSSPKALLRSFYASRGEIDGATLSSLLHAANELEQKVLESRIQIELAIARLRNSEREKFGKATTSPAVGARLEPPNLSELDSFVEKIEGDHATVADPRDPTISLSFVRVEGKWKMPISSLVGRPLDAAVAESMSATARALVQDIDHVTTEITAGRVVNEEQVMAELNKRLAARIAATSPSTTQSTRPAASAPAK